MTERTRNATSIYSPGVYFAPCVMENSEMNQIVNLVGREHHVDLCEHPMVLIMALRLDSLNCLNSMHM